MRTKKVTWYYSEISSHMNSIYFSTFQSCDLPTVVGCTAQQHNFIAQQCQLWILLQHCVVFYNNVNC